MRLSLVMPVWNEAACIVPALQALAPLRQRGVELIVVDGGSSDGTASLAAPLADRVIVASLGRALQMNAGAAAARGDILLFLHADTQLPDGLDGLDGPAGALTAIERALVEPRHDWGRFDVRIVGRSPWLALVGFMMNQRSRLSGIATGDQALFVRRSTFDAVGGYPPQPLMEDIELSRRLRRISAPVCLRERVSTSGRRWETHGVWRTIWLMWQLRLLYWLGTPVDQLAARYR